MPRPFATSAAIVLAMSVSASGCAPAPQPLPTPSPTPTPEVTAMTFRLTSDVFSEGGSIPRRYTCQGDDPSPPLAWSGAPPGTAAFALIVDDPDASGWVHWLVWDLPGGASSLAEGASGSVGVEGRTSWGTIGWRGPCPPSGSHRYVFRLFALSAPLGLPNGAEAPAVLRAAAGLTLAEATLSGTYRKT